MEVSSQPKCSICYKVANNATCTQCSEVLTSVITSLTKVPANPFSNIDNLVFQGGGVKGAAYLGVLEQLNKESDGFLTKVKRVAGSSAGSIVALYLALNLDLNYMGKLVKEKYSNLLDEGMGLVIKGENKKVTAKLVFLTAIQYFKILKKEVHDEKKSAEALRKIKKISTDIKGYYTNKLWGYQKFFFNTVVGDRSAEAFTSCILDLLGVSYIIKNAKKRIYEEESKLEEESRQQILEEALETESHVYLPLEKRIITSTTTIEKAEGRQIIIEESSTDLVIERSETNDTENATRVISSVRESQVITESSDRVMEPAPMAKSRVESSFFGKISNFVWGEKSKKIITEFDLSNENDRKLLHYALAELLIQIKDFQEDKIEFKYDTNKIGPKMDEDELADHLARNFNIPKNQSKKDPLGVFTGDTVKQKMIIEPIKTAFKPLPMEIGSNGPTFAQMAEAKVFKDLYVTAFNCATNRTEVFSAEHTPNVFVADAVRASMSIPGFFKPVHISQKFGETVENRRIYFEKKNEVRNEDVLFMDGGILDNYPLWIFDDIKYLLSDITLNAKGQEARTQRFSIQNQKTLGFKLLDPETLERYTHPYINNNLDQMKRTNEASQATGNKWTFVGGTLLGSKMDQEENEFIKFGNCSRTVYVDNANVSPLAFDMDDEVVNRLIHNGEDSVKKYKERFERHFLNEGQAYSAYSSK